ncbi:hypothetical protein V6N13_043370 [Hibiscus sabdariffa]
MSPFVADAFNTELLLSCMERLRRGQPVSIPSYDFKTHTSIEPSRLVNPADVIILEGILVLHDSQVRNLMNMKIFVDTDSDVRLARRIQRDTVERGRNISNVLDQVRTSPTLFISLVNFYTGKQTCGEVFLTDPGIVLQYSRFVKPSFEEFILPSKKFADIIIPRGGDNDVAVDLIVQHILTKLGQHDLCKIYPNINVIFSTFQIRGMHTLVRDVKTTKHDFVFYSDRLIRLVVEHGLGHLPFTEKQIITPTGSVYSGVVFCKRLCGVSVIRRKTKLLRNDDNLLCWCQWRKHGECTKSMLQGNQNRHANTIFSFSHQHLPQLIYEKLPADISSRHVLLLDPVLASGNSAIKAVSLLLSKGVPETSIIFLNLISAPEGIHAVCRKFPRLKIVTSEIDSSLDKNYRVIPGMGEFGDRYFGTD